MTNSFRARSTLTAGNRWYEIWSLAALPQDKLARLPYSLKILLENLLRFEDGVSVTRADIRNSPASQPKPSLYPRGPAIFGGGLFSPPGAGGARRAYPDTLVGTDSHTTMINGLGVLGWGVGGIEAEAAMLGQAVTMLIPQVIGFRLDGRLQPGATATDLVLTVTEMLRKKGVVDKFVEFFGDGLANLPLADRATIG